MQLIKEPNDASFMIKSYEPHKLIINDSVYCESVILTPNSIKPWGPKTLKDLTINHIQQLAEYSSSIVLIGTGKTQKFLDDSLLLPLIKKNLSVEIMSTLSACYTFKVLSSENRAVVAGLLV